MRPTCLAWIAGALIASLSLACGGPSTQGSGGGGGNPISVRVENNYAESLFSVAYSVDLPDGGTMTGTVFKDERIAAYDSAEKDAFHAPDGSRVTWTFGAESLGERQAFSPFQEDLNGRAGDYYVFTYDYDTATANFSVSHAWSGF